MTISFQSKQKHLPELERQHSGVLARDNPKTAGLVKHGTRNAAVDKIYCRSRELRERETSIQNDNLASIVDVRDNGLVEHELLAVDGHAVHDDRPARSIGDVDGLSRGTEELGLLRDVLEAIHVLANGERAFFGTVLVVRATKQDSEHVRRRSVLQKHPRHEAQSLRVVLAEVLKGLDEDGRAEIEGKAQNAEDVVAEDSTEVGGIRGVQDR